MFFLQTFAMINEECIILYMLYIYIFSFGTCINHILFSGMRVLFYRGGWCMINERIQLLHHIDGVTIAWVTLLMAVVALIPSPHTMGICIDIE